MGSSGPETPSKYRLGVDVGGTNTDAALISLSPTAIITAHKAPTTPDLTTGITEAINTVVHASGVPLDAIDCVIIGTTHFVNAVVQRSSLLQHVGVVRLCGGSRDGFGLEVPPFIDFPEDLRYHISGGTYFCQGGNQISGSEISPLDENELNRTAEDLVKSQVFNVVVSGIYSPINSAHEDKAGEILLKRMRELINASGISIQPRVTLSYQISSLGFLARENASILNASLRPLAEKTIFGFQRAISDIFEGTPCALYLTQNDGSILNAPDAVKLPIRTFNSGPTNSIRGGEFLWNTASRQEGDDKRTERQEPLVVIDIGGTTSDSGLLLPNGLPRMSSVMSLVGGVRTNFALPAVESVGLGGGSVVSTFGGNLTVGPESVALELLKKARLFGGDVLTATDIFAASEMHSPSDENPLKGIGDIAYLKSIPVDVVQKAKEYMRRTIEELVDRTKVQEGDIDVLIVGGGAILIDTNEPLAGVRTVRRVKGGEFANAVGAAISQVSGVLDTMVDTSHQTLKEAQEKVVDLAVEAAVSKGAQRETIRVAEITVLPIQYVDKRARMLIRAVGILDAVKGFDSSPTSEPESFTGSQKDSGRTLGPGTRLAVTPDHVDVKAYRPQIEQRRWIISTIDIEWIASGCRVLGCGGGGEPYQEYLKIRAILEKSPGTVKVVSPMDLPENGTVGWTGHMGSPEVTMERMAADECNKAHDELTRVTGIPPVDAFVALEIGGGNGLVNLAVAAAHDAPCVDADYMGRAYPTYWQTTPNVYGTARGEALVPATIASGDGSFITLTNTKTDKLADSILRAAIVEMGCAGGKAGPPKPVTTVQQQAIANSVSLAWWIGRAIALEKNVTERANRIIDAVGGPKSAKVLAEGKIVRVERVLKTGHTYGVVEIDGFLSDKGTKATIRIPFKNENAFVEATSADGGQNASILASVPDLIAVLDSETGMGLGTPEYKYGLRVTVIAIAASPRWTDTPRGLALGGPASMGFDDIEYVPIGHYSKPRSVIEVYS